MLQLPLFEPLAPALVAAKAVENRCAEARRQMEDIDEHAEAA
jgi:hypothetical protein